VGTPHISPAISRPIPITLGSKRKKAPWALGPRGLSAPIGYMALRFDLLEAQSDLPTPQGSRGGGLSVRFGTLGITESFTPTPDADVGLSPT
jgi:hypothetical protein